jgi:hypothetical protein
VSLIIRPELPTQSICSNALIRGGMAESSNIDRGEVPLFIRITHFYPVYENIVISSMQACLLFM